MRIEYDSRFNKDLRKLKKKNRTMLRRIEKKMDQIEEIVLEAETFDEVESNLPGLLKLVGHDNYYRIRVGDHRIGIEFDAFVIFDELTFIFVRCGHRKDFYDIFPPGDD